MTWTRFMDMHSGGGRKESWEYIYIEAPEDEARVIFYNRFGHNPERVTCTCCGNDYSITEEPTLAIATGYERNCNTLKTPRLPDGSFDNGLHDRDPWFAAHYYIDPEDEEEARRRGYEIEENRSRQIGIKHGSDYGQYIPLDEYIAGDMVLVIRADDIKPEDREGFVPEQGYVWVG